MRHAKAIATLAAFAGAVSIAAAANAAKLTATTSLMKTHDQSIIYFDLFHDPVNKADNGITLDYKGGPEVIPNRKQGAALKRGAIDVMFGPAAYYAGLVPCARIVTLSNVPQAEIRENGGWALLDECWKKGLNAKLLAHGMEGGTTFHVYLTKDYKPLVSEETGLNLSGLTMRSTSGYHPLLKKMGARPVNISPGDIYTSLERGVVQGVCWPEGAVARYGWAKFIKYRVGPGWWRTSSMLVINLDAYNKMSKEQREAIQAAALKYEQDSGPALRKLADIDTKKVFEAGVKPVDLTGKARDAYLRTVYDATWDAAEKHLDPATFKKLRSLLLK